MIKIGKYSKQFEFDYFDTFKSKLIKNNDIKISLSSFYNSNIELNDFFTILLSNNYFSEEIESIYKSKILLYIELKKFVMRNDLVLTNNLLKYLKCINKGLLTYSGFNTYRYIKNYTKRNKSKIKRIYSTNLVTRVQILNIKRIIKKRIQELEKVLIKHIKYSKVENVEGLRERILKNTNLLVCPYCNRNPIDFFIEKDLRKKTNGLERERTTGDLDHFLSKSKFPLLSMSLYNFIPACSLCNRLFKLDNSINILNPYISGFGNDVCFIIDEDENDLWLKSIEGKNENVKFKLINNSRKNHDNINESIKLFRINQLYNSGNYIGFDLLKKRNFINHVANRNLDLYFDENLIYGFDFTDEEQLRKPYSKFAKDLLNK